MQLSLSSLKRAARLLRLIAQQTLPRPRQKPRSTQDLDTSKTSALRRESIWHRPLTRRTSPGPQVRISTPISRLAESPWLRQAQAHTDRLVRGQISNRPYRKLRPSFKHHLIRFRALTCQTLGTGAMLMDTTSQAISLTRATAVHATFWLATQCSSPASRFSLGKTLNCRRSTVWIAALSTKAATVVGVTSTDSSWRTMELSAPPMPIMKHLLRLKAAASGRATHTSLELPTPTTSDREPMVACRSWI